MRGSDARERSRARRKGFTLIELSIVLLIIGILMGFILAASYEGVQRAQMRSTQALIAKLDTGINFRLDDLLSRQVEPNGAHQFMASVYPTSQVSTTILPWGIPSDQRAQVIAKYDLVKRELPDVFYVDLVTDANYPLNFAGPPYGGGNSPGPLNYVLPLGHSVAPGFTPVDPTTYNQADPTGKAAYLDPDGDGNNNVGPGAYASGFYGGTTGLTFNPAGEGIYGASYAAAAGVYKNLGYLPAGYDGTDNDNDGWIDEYDEGVNGTNSALVTANLANHTHKTARSEMLYALLVEGQGSRGSVFTREDFAERDIGDTDGDGLPEFLDAWGEPIQFYRWPVHHGDKQLQTFIDGSGNPQSQVVYGGTQQGYYPYRDSRQPRERSALDPNNQLVAPAWWSATYNAGSGNEPFGAPGKADMSSHAFMFQRYFHPLVDLAINGVGSATNIYTWDLSGTYRRAFFSRHLIVSSGPDQRLGIPMIGFNYSEYEISTAPSTGPPQDAGAQAAGVWPSQLQLTPDNLIQVENTASDMSPIRDFATSPWLYPDSTYAGSTDIQNGIQGDLLGDLSGWGFDDITNQNLPRAGGGIQ